FELARTLAVEQSEAEQRRSRWGSGRLYLSTQEKIAIARLGKTLVTHADTAVAGTLAIGGTSSEISPERLWSRAFDAAELRAGVRLTPRGDLPLYVTTDVAGVPKVAPAPDDYYVSIQRRYYTLDGKGWDPGPLREGDALIVGISMEAREAMPDALLV